MQPKLVRRGQTVTLLAQSPGFEVRSAGRALQDGVAGGTDFGGEPGLEPCHTRNSDRLRAGSGTYVMPFTDPSATTKDLYYHADTSLKGNL